MCSPVVAAIAVQAVGTMSSANAQRQAGTANAAIAAQNAAVAKAQEQSVYEKGAVQEVAYSNQLKELQGRAVAAAGDNGIVANRGSPLDLLVQSTGFGERDIRQIENNAAMEAFGYEAQATNFTNQGLLDAFEGKQQSDATLLTGLGSAGFGAAKAFDFGSSPSPRPSAAGG